MSNFFDQLVGIQNTFAILKLIERIIFLFKFIRKCVFKENFLNIKTYAVTIKFFIHKSTFLRDLLYLTCHFLLRSCVSRLHIHIHAKIIKVYYVFGVSALRQRA